MAWNLITRVGAMFRLRIESKFDAAHKIDGYEGKCAKLHGHTYKMEVFVLAKKTDAIGISVDQKLLKEKLLKITELLDHSFLNDLKEIGNPSMENISRFVFENMKDLPVGITLEKVRIWETPTAWCEYFES